MSGTALDKLSLTPTVQEFRDELGGNFVDSSVYTDAMIQPLLDMASVSLNPRRWGQFYRNGVEWFVAHFLTMSSIAGKAKGLSGYGMVSSKAVGSVSIGYDFSVGTELNAGHWNLTLWGRMYIHQARLVGMGGVQVGYPGSPPSVPGEPTM